MEEYDATKILKASPVEVDPSDTRTTLEIVNDPRLGLVPARQAIEITPIEE